MQLYLSSKHRETVAELSARLGISERKAYELKEEERESDRQAIKAAVDYLLNEEGLTQVEVGLRVEKSQSTISELLLKIRQAREKAR